MAAKYVIFDLDDTLIQEIDFLKSAYHEIAQTLDPDNYFTLFTQMIQDFENGKNVFEEVIHFYPNTSIVELLTLYRNHFPNLELNEGALEVLNWCKEKGYYLGLITDGRSVTQRNKIKAAGLQDYFDKIIISEEFGTAKPNPRNFEAFILNNVDQYVYIADNTSKDFIVPNQLGWNTICLLNKGFNIHPQNLNGDPTHMPQHIVDHLKQVISILENLS